MPRVNWTLLAAVLVLVVVFRTSSALASAYGIAVTGTMIVTSLLAFAVLRRAWRWPLALALAVIAPLLAVETIFLGANLAKLHRRRLRAADHRRRRRPADDDLGARHRHRPGQGADAAA